MTFTKDPNAVLDYTIDWARWLAGDQIVTSEWIIPSGLTLMADSKTATSSYSLALLRRGGPVVHRHQPHHDGGRTDRGSLVHHSGRGALRIRTRSGM